MKRRTKTIVIGVMAAVLALAVAVPAFAARDTAATVTEDGYCGYGHGAMMGAGIRGIDAAAEVLGMDLADVAAARQDGKSLADLAAERGISNETLTSALLDARKAALDEAVASERITQEQADLMIEHMTETVADHIDDTTVGPRGGMRGSGGMGFGGQGMRDSCGLSVQ